MSDTEVRRLAHELLEDGDLRCPAFLDGDVHGPMCKRLTAALSALTAERDAARIERDEARDANAKHAAEREAAVARAEKAERDLAYPVDTRADALRDMLTTLANQSTSRPGEYGEGWNACIAVVSAHIERHVEERLSTQPADAAR